ncbi:pectate lyase [Podospora aff. communis PSN243]|uniref:Pectate lyase n=1 Tax=Podospora aff. communis PSN243 TaxID=3040156 RepID=A0AAV9GV21_9PEZI|nr:pectate lyase [Podospora aff. communis PSN243]
MTPSWSLLTLAALAAAQQRTFPNPSGTTNLPSVRTIAAGQSFDGGMRQWDRNPSTCNGQSEGGEKDAVFILEHGATLSNVIIGPNNGEGVHCKGACTLNNVWWTDVCEDAATFRQSSSSHTSYVNGGGARNADDKVFQHNGAGTVIVQNFFASNIGKLYRSCGNCGTQHARRSEFRNVHVEKGKVVAGVNGNLGDRTVVRDSCVLGGAVCENFEGNNSGKEPKKVGSGPDGVVCIAQNVRTSGC